MEKAHECSDRCECSIDSRRRRLAFVPQIRAIAFDVEMQVRRAFLEEPRGQFDERHTEPAAQTSELVLIRAKRGPGIPGKEGGGEMTSRRRRRRLWNRAADGHRSNSRHGRPRNRALFLSR